MKKTLLSFFVLMQVVTGLSQSKQQTYKVKARIVEEETSLVLPYASVMNKQRALSTASNAEGYFELPGNRLGDTITISYLGYLTRQVVVAEKMPQEISLTPNSLLLGEIVITPNDYLYDLVAKVKRRNKTRQKTAKTYFYLETILNQDTVEMIESYYNGQYADLGIASLDIKKGRIGLRPSDNRLFHSTESSRLFSMHNLCASSEVFPDNPLSLGKRALKRKYLLKLEEVYFEDSAKIYVIHFQPKKDETNLFEGTVWIDQTSNNLVQIRLQVQDAKAYPFIPWPSETNVIHRVDMEITRSYELIDDEAFINAIDFNYRVVYADQFGEKINVSTKAFSKAYDFSSAFRLPYFEFSKQFYGDEDYRNIAVSPYDAAFWNGTTEFRLYERKQAVDEFMQQYHISNYKLSPQTAAQKFAQLEFPYIPWSEQRFHMRKPSVEQLEASSRSKPYESDKYHFNVKLYFDVNFIRDSFTYQLLSILDPVDTYYLFDIEGSDLAFMNLYFDLMELEKRKLEKALQHIQKPEISQLEAIYQQHLQSFNENCKQLISETRRGANLRATKKWSDYIRDALGIDNFKLCNLDQKD